MTTPETPIPSIEEVRASMSNLSQAALRALAEKSGVSFHVLVKIRTGYTPNPGIETVRKFYGHLSEVAEQYPPVRTAKDAE